MHISGLLVCVVCWGARIPNSGWRTRQSVRRRSCQRTAKRALRSSVCWRTETFPVSSRASYSKSFVPLLLNPPLLNCCNRQLQLAVLPHAITHPSLHATKNNIRGPSTYERQRAPQQLMVPLTSGYQGAPHLWAPGSPD